MDAIQMNMSELLSNLQVILREENVVKEDLVRPAPQRVQTLYYKLLLEFGFSEAMLRDSPELQGLGDSVFAAGSWDATPGLYQHNQELDLLMEAIRYFFEKMGRGQEGSVFSLFDLIEPDAKRTRRFLASMVNFWNFCNVNYSAANAIKEGVMKNSNLRAGMLRDLEGLHGKIESIRKINAEDAMKVSNLDEKIKQMEQELSELVNEINAEKKRAEQAKNELVDKRAEEEKLLMEVDQLKRKEELVRAGLENEGQLGEMEAERVKLIDEGRDLLSRLKTIEQKSSEASNRAEVMETLTKRLGDLQAVYDKIRTVNSNLETARQKVELLTAEESDLGTQNEETNRKIAKAHALLVTAERKWGKVRNMKQTEIDMVEGKIAEAKQQLGEEEIVSSDLQSRIRKAEKLIEELKIGKEQRLAVANNEKLKFLETVRDKAEEIHESKEYLQELLKKI